MLSTFDKMMTVIVPLDFSETSFNAAHYAANMYKDRPGSKIILYHFYEKGEDISTASNYLNSIKDELTACVPDIETELESGENFIDSLAAFAHARTAYMIVMGLTGKTALAQRFSGSNTLKMADKNVCPVLIIPPGVKYSSIKNVMISSEMKYVNESPALLAVKRVLAYFKPALHIVHINPDIHVSLPPEIKEERDKMEELLKEFNPEFYFIRLYDFHEAVNNFTESKNIDMIIIAPKHHSIYEKLFKEQHTKQLIYHSTVPVLAVHE